jgi:hypothetical protein
MIPMKSTTSLTNHDSQSLIAHNDHTKPSAPPVFVLCDRCYWCATYFSKARMPTDNNICPQCNANNNELTSFPIASDIYNYNEKRRVELEFKDRRSLQ